MPKLHDQTVAVRLPAKLLRAIRSMKHSDESLSDCLRRLLSQATHDGKGKS